MCFADDKHALDCSRCALAIMNALQLKGGVRRTQEVS